jgi:hypothetical protein
MSALSHTIQYPIMEYEGYFYLIQYKPGCDNVVLLQARHGYPPLQFHQMVIEETPQIYTWIVGRMKNGELCFWAKKCINQYEFFTKHQEILYDVECTNPNKVVTNENCIDSVICAGEILIPRDKDAIFNFSSGSFMTGKSSHDYGEEKLFIIQNFAAQGIIIDFTEDITSFILHTTDDKTMRQLDATGIIDIYKFDNIEQPTNFLRSHMDIQKLEHRLKLETIQAAKYAASKNPSPNYIEEDQAKIHRMNEEILRLRDFRESCRSNIIQLEPAPTKPTRIIPHGEPEQSTIQSPIRIRAEQEAGSKRKRWRGTKRKRG